MLSILIPIYNYDVRPLVKTLHQQAENSGVQYEILCMDDASALDFQELNRELEQLTHLRYIILPQNAGRAAIRNLLAKEAKFDYCLFMDCDTMPENDRFIDLYVQNLKPNTVICGGRSYAPEMSANSNFYLHWFYGSQREVKPAAARARFPYYSFMTNNFLMPRHLILDIPFDETIKQYGHEDTLFGLVLMEKSIPILHIANPLRHVGLDEKNDFIRKAEQAVENLFQLKDIHDFKDSVRLLNTFEKTKRLGMHPLLRIWFKINKNRLLKNLKSSYPKLRNLDLYKLGYMATL